MRALTTRERTLIAALIADPATAVNDHVTAADRGRWLAQLRHTRAGNSCGCGTCPSIELMDPDGSTPDETSPTRIILETSTPEWLLLLFIDDDQLSYLELAPFSDLPVLEFPDLAQTELRPQP